MCYKNVYIDASNNKYIGICCIIFRNTLKRKYILRNPLALNQLTFDCLDKVNITEGGRDICFIYVRKSPSSRKLIYQRLVFFISHYLILSNTVKFKFCQTIIHFINYLLKVSYLKMEAFLIQEAL